MIRYEPQPGYGEPSSCPEPLPGSQSISSGMEEGMVSSAQQLKDKAIQTRDQLTESVKSRASSYFDQRKHTVADTVSDVCEVTRHCVQEMEQKNHPRIGGFVNSLADRMQDFDQTLRQKDINYFLDRAQDFARRRPGLFLGGALAAGFLAVRFLKSSSPQQPSFEPPSSQESITPGIHNEVPASAGTQFTI